MAKARRAEHEWEVGSEAVFNRALFVVGSAIGADFGVVLLSCFSQSAAAKQLTEMDPEDFLITW